MCQPKVTDDQELKETAAADLFPLFTAAPFFLFPVDENYRAGSVTYTSDDQFSFL